MTRVPKKSDSGVSSKPCHTKSHERVRLATRGWNTRIFFPRERRTNRFLYRMTARWFSIYSGNDGRKGATFVRCGFAVSVVTSIRPTSCFCLRSPIEPQNGVSKASVPFSTGSAANRRDGQIKTSAGTRLFLGRRTGRSAGCKTTSRQEPQRPPLPRFPIAPS